MNPTHPHPPAATHGPTWRDLAAFCRRRAADAGRPNPLRVLKGIELAEELLGGRGPAAVDGMALAAFRSLLVATGYTEGSAATYLSGLRMALVTLGSMPTGFRAEPAPAAVPPSAPGDADDEADGVYRPSREEIAEGCRLIRKGWSPRERYWRAKGCDGLGRPIHPGAIARRRDGKAA